ncbi:MAG TPA: chemotaxis protein CheB [Nitrospirales bacterium]|nr:chemotaxis protein CheB [Nitrospirales bacterium]
MVNDEQIRRDVIVLGASAGGVEALTVLFANFAQDLPAVIGCVLHRSPTFNVQLAWVLGRRSTLKIVEPANGDPLKSNIIHLAPSDHHMLFHPGQVEVSRGPQEHFTRPAIDPLFRSAAAAFGERVVGVLLTGAGDDGVTGLVQIKAAGGLVLVQDPEEAKVPSMPQSAVTHDHVDLVLPLASIADALLQLARGNAIAA